MRAWNRTQAFEWYHFLYNCEWPLTKISRSRHCLTLNIDIVTRECGLTHTYSRVSFRMTSVTRSIARLLCDSWTSCWYSYCLTNTCEQLFLLLYSTEMTVIWCWARLVSDSWVSLSWTILIQARRWSTSLRTTWKTSDPEEYSRTSRPVTWGRLYRTLLHRIRSHGRRSSTISKQLSCLE